jgi:hypothetical protein
MRKFKIIYAIIGVILAAGVLMTSLAGLPERDRELYEKACSLEDGRSDSIWPGLRISDYPVALRKGNTEYVLFNGSVEKRRPVLPVIACTAYPADGTVNVFVPCKSVMDSLGQIAEGFSSGTEDFLIGQFSIESRRMSNNQYIAVLYHETMHAFQLSRYDYRIAEMANWEDADMEEMITELETDPVIQALYKKQTELLYRMAAVDTGVPDMDDIREYIKTRDETLEAFCLKAGKQNGDMIGAYIDVTELMEGTARYAEAKTAQVLNDSELYEQYLSSLQETLPGREKYYRSGMGICMLLDKLSTGWKDSLFADGLTLAGMLEKAAEVFDDGGNEVYDTAG